MKRTPLAGLALALAALPAAAQAPKIGGLVQVWYTQMMDHNLRLNSAPAIGGYYNLRSEFKENGFAVRRTELKFSGKVWEEEGRSLDYEVMIDPSINTSATNPTILQDAALHLKLDGGFEVKLGQFKNQQTFEGLTSSSELVLAERSQIGRVFGDKRDRGAVAALTFGDPKAFSAKVLVGLFNGMNDATAGKTNDTNAQKDVVGRVEFTAAKAHRFGAYALQGATDLADKGALAAKNFNGVTNPPGLNAQVLDARDRTTNLGVYYAYQDATWTFMGEAMTGLLGRRASSLAGGTGSREHLDQRFLGYYALGAHTAGRHTFAVRYDRLNYNQGDDFHAAYNPYKMSSPTASLGADFSPTFTEVTLGYTYALKPETLKAANLKVNYVGRSRNFLKPRAGQSGEQGGDTLMAAFQVAF